MLPTAGYRSNGRLTAPVRAAAVTFICAAKGSLNGVDGIVIVLIDLFVLRNQLAFTYLTVLRMRHSKTNHCRLYRLG